LLSSGASFSPLLHHPGMAEISRYQTAYNYSVRRSDFKDRKECFAETQTLLVFNTQFKQDRNGGGSVQL
jgi:hypothetical protein